MLQFSNTAISSRLVDFSHHSPAIGEWLRFKQVCKSAPAASKLVILHAAFDLNEWRHKAQTERRQLPLELDYLIQIIQLFFASEPAQR
jgi:hypothetical protein